MEVGKNFENEFAFLLSNEIKKQDLFVETQYKRLDIAIFDEEKELNSIIEIGHYSLNQALMKKLKAKEDIDKRNGKYSGKKIFHIQLIDDIDNKNYKYQRRNKPKIKEYYNLYKDENLSYKLILKKINSKLGSITTYIIISRKK